MWDNLTPYFRQMMREGKDVYGTGNFHTPQLVSTCRLFRKKKLITLMDKVIGFLYLTYREELSADKPT